MSAATATQVRRIIEIDEEKCDGCGLCATACHEGAIQIIDGKARLVSEVYCDGLGDCLGECPQGAITIVEREAQEFDQEAVRRRLAKQDRREEVGEGQSAAGPGPAGGCPGARMLTLEPREARPADQSDAVADAMPSALRNWPVQIHLMPVAAPYLQDAKLLIAADCAPFAYAGFHGRFLEGRTLLVGCPKLDDAEAYRRKLAQMFLQNDIQSVEVVYMEVPCCFGLVHLVQLALDDSGKAIPLTLTKISIDGQVRETVSESCC